MCGACILAAASEREPDLIGQPHPHAGIPWKGRCTTYECDISCRIPFAASMCGRSGINWLPLSGTRRFLGTRKSTIQRL